MLFGKDEAIFSLAKPVPAADLDHGRRTEERAQASDLIHMKVLHIRPEPRVYCEDKLPGTVNYIRGDNPSNWHTGIPTFSRLKYEGIYPGIDLIYYGTQQELEFDFSVAPGADPRAIELQFNGAQRLTLDSNGSLIIAAAHGSISFRRPTVYQTAANEERQPVAGAFRIVKGNVVEFAVGPYDSSRQLVIDPILNYSTYFGPGSGAVSVAVNSAGEAFVAGSAPDSFPTSAGSFQANPVNPGYARFHPYVVKFNSTGTALLYSTFISGSGSDFITGLALDAAGNAYVTGSAGSPDFPVTTGAFETVNRASVGSAFVTVLNSSGTGLIYSTYLGGGKHTVAAGVATDASGDAYITGITYDADFPTTHGAFQMTEVAKSLPSFGSGFVTKLNASGTALAYSTFLAGSRDDSPMAIQVDSSGSAYIGGSTRSLDFPTTAGAFQNLNKAPDWGTGFVTKLNADGSALIYSTLLGGSFLDAVSAIAVDSSGSVLATGNTSSSDFPTTPGVFQSKLTSSAFISKLNGMGTGLVYSTLLGGTTNVLGGISADYGSAIVVDGQGNALVAGSTAGLDFPVTRGAFETLNLPELFSNDSGSFLTKMNSTGTAILYSTYLGGTGDQSGGDCDCAMGLAMDPAGNAYLAGITQSADFPLTKGVLWTAFSTWSPQSFLSVFNAAEMKSLPLSKLTLGASSNPQIYGRPLTITAQVQGNSGNMPTGTVYFSVFGIELSDQGDFTGMGPWTPADLDSSGIATFDPKSVLSGSLPIYAYYLGDAKNSPTMSSMTETINPVPTATTLAANITKALYGTPITFTATVLDDSGKAALGQVTIMVNGVDVKGLSLDPTGKAIWITGLSGANLPVGTDTVTARFNSEITGTPYATSSASVTIGIDPLGATAAPAFNPAAGTYTSKQQVSLSDVDSSAAIYFTVDGSTPVVGVSTLYATGSPIPVSADETIEAVAVAPGYSSSLVASAAYTINLPPPDFALTVSPSTLTLTGGQSGTVSVSVSSDSANGFSGSVSLSCSGLPVGASCSFSPSTVFTGNMSSMRITTSTKANNNVQPMRPFRVPATIAVGILFLLRRSRRKWLRASVFVFLVGMLITICACGGGSGASGSGNGVPPPITSTVTITGVSGSQTHTTQLVLTVD